MTLAFHNYHDTHGSFPPAYTVDENGKPLHSWRVLILPFIEQSELYKKIRLNEPWDSEYNRQFHGIQIRTFQCPTRRDTLSARNIRNVFVKNRDILCMENCDYSVVIGEETIFSGSQAITFSDISNGTSNTILIVERMLPVNWMDPNNEIRFDVAREGVNRNLRGIGSEHFSGGANVGFADGSVRFLPNDTDCETLREMLTYKLAIKGETEE
jgi:prepilin-type processing-associated H-X9-DG protein